MSCELLITDARIIERIGKEAYIMMKPHSAPTLFVAPGGYEASKAVATMNVTQFQILPQIRVQRRPKRSMKQMQRNCAIKAMMELIA